MSAWLAVLLMAGWFMAGMCVEQLLTRLEEERRPRPEQRGCPEHNMDGFRCVHHEGHAGCHSTQIGAATNHVWWTA